MKLLSLISSCRLHQLLLVQLHSVDSMEYDKDDQSSAASTDKDDIHTHNNNQKLPIKTSALSSLHTIKYTKLTTGINIIVLLYYAVVGEFITTVAHVCAILLGLLLWKIALWI